ncbi:MAG: cytochrome c oxidase subunit I, partial [Solirubrobacteraceae bacterium]|nr:cytochrome c oxidase subunit I [Solirubrobacteraceae bacterium]
MAHLRAPGWYRAAFYTALAGALSWLLLWSANGFSASEVTGIGWVQVMLISFPLFFLGGMGAFDYWIYWASGRPTRPEDHSAHGATSWKDYFRINTDHKVIGIQY